MEAGGSAWAPRAATSTRRKLANPKVLLVLVARSFMANMLLPVQCQFGEATMRG
jgi:hypothetical protein